MHVKESRVGQLGIIIIRHNRKGIFPQKYCETCAGVIFHIEKAGHTSMPKPGVNPGVPAWQEANFQFTPGRWAV